MAFSSHDVHCATPTSDRLAVDGIDRTALEDVCLTVPPGVGEKEMAYNVDVINSQ